VADAVSNIPGDDLMENLSSRALAVSLAVGLALISGIYGGLHVSALYGYYFPSDLETTMWKLFSIWVLIGGLTAPLLMVTVSQCNAKTCDRF
jgi:hypothetical protein